MELTLTEALRIKNEISNTIKTLTYNIHTSSFGETTEDGEVISEDKEKFYIVETSLLKALKYSEELNNTISSFNKENEVDVIVRKMQNAKLLLDIYTRNLQKTKPNKQKRFENLGTVRKSIEIIYVPDITSKNMKEKMSQQKSLVRDYQSQVEKLNQNKIEVSFGYNNLENLIV